MAKRVKPPVLSDADCMVFLCEIEEGAVALTPEYDPSTFFNGTLVYRASNGWEIGIYIDAYEWDYVDYIKAADGRETDGCHSMGPAGPDCYYPSKETALKRYGIRNVPSY